MFELGQGASCRLVACSAIPVRYRVAQHLDTLLRFKKRLQSEDRMRHPRQRLVAGLQAHPPIGADGPEDAVIEGFLADSAGLHGDIAPVGFRFDLFVQPFEQYGKVGARTLRKQLTVGACPCAIPQEQTIAMGQQAHGALQNRCGIFGGAKSFSGEEFRGGCEIIRGH
ncbi:hypothetical protein CKO19_03625 [Rhodovulum adriaticum]|nr:hypothetical protein [Rhodovulum adriaticum]